VTLFPPPCVGAIPFCIVPDAGGFTQMSDTEDYVIASYREIAERFGLGDSRTARNKAKRAGWVHEPVNHPADPRRVRVPRARWDEALTPRGRRADPPGSEAQTEDEDLGPGFQAAHEQRGSGVQTVGERQGSPVQTEYEHRGSPAPDHGNSDPCTEDKPQVVKDNQRPDHRGSKRRTPQDQERDAQRIKDLEAMVGLLHEQLTRERGRADTSDARVAELTTQLIALAERRTTLVEQMAKAAQAGRALFSQSWWRFPRS
jgi:hypothetical protein